MGQIPLDLQVGGFLRLRAPELCSPVRSPVLAHLARLPWHSRFVHENEGSRLLRELTPRDVFAAGVRDRKPRRLERLRPEHLGPYGSGWTARHGARRSRKTPPLLDIL